MSQSHPNRPVPSSDLTGSIIDSAFKVHQTLGPGMLESAYEHCLAHELTKRGLEIRRQVVLPIHYDEITLDAGYRLDLIVNGVVIVEVKAVQKIDHIHKAQMLTYLRFSGIRVGLLINFNVMLIKDGIARLVL